MHPPDSLPKAKNASPNELENPDPIPDAFYSMLRSVWGFSELRPPQRAAVAAVLARKDALIVMPTGGGKSLCYQAPAIFMGGLTIVVSPLIALMKDQVDSLHQVGVPAIRMDSTLSSDEKRQTAHALKSGKTRLLFVSPERLCNPDFIRFLEGIQVQNIAIDEAHCVSQWGHDFRPEYRQLGALRSVFPNAAFQAFTATATEKVQRDIVEQLALVSPRVHISSFDRPNLTYRVLPQLNVLEQIKEVCSRHRGSGGIVYCLRRADVEATTEYLKKHGFSVAAYHAGMSNNDRKISQDAFLSESVDVVVATVAFGMGIDRSNVRYVVHASVPKSIEHYQQETGRAGRDGLPAECVLFYSLADVVALKRITESSLMEANAAPEIINASRAQLDELSRYCQSAVCRHRALVEYFGQRYEAASCGACDHCLGDTQSIDDAKVISQKILSCVFRVQERFGVNYVTSILHGARAQNITQRGHDKLSTYGLLAQYPLNQIRDWIYQLIGQGAVDLIGTEYPILKLNAQSREILFSDATPRLIKTAQSPKATRQSKSTKEKSAISLQGTDSELFERLRTLRRKLASEQHVPPYMVFSDNTLLELAKIRPTSSEDMLKVTGVGSVKLKAYGIQVLECINQYCEQNPSHNTSTPDSRIAAVSSSASQSETHTFHDTSRAVKINSRTNPKEPAVFRLLKQGLPIDNVAAQIDEKPTWVWRYLLRLLERDPSVSIAPWIADEVRDEVIATAFRVGFEALKPIYEDLNQRVPYEVIKTVLADFENNANRNSAHDSDVEASGD